jgi:chromosomal replication initiator protein
MTQEHEQLWQKCLAHIRKSIGDQLFFRWFSDARSVSFDNGALTIQVPSDYIREQYEDRFYAHLGKAIQAVYGDGIDLYYQIGIIQDDDASKVTLRGNKHQIPAAPQAIAATVQRQEGVNYQEVQSGLIKSNTFENYCVGMSNQLPYTIAKAIADHPEKNDFNPFFLYGSVGVGKTHLIQAIGNRIKENIPQARVLYISLRSFQNQFSTATITGRVPDFINFYQSIDVLMIDDLQELAGKKGTIDALFTIFNHLHQGGKKLIFTCDRPPVNLEGITDRLIDRFKWGSTEPLPKPDLALRKKILQIKAASSGIDFPQDVIDVIAEHVDGSVRELEGVVAGVINRAIYLSAPINKALALEVMRNTVKTPTKTINFDMIVDITAECFKINPDVIFSKNRVRDIADARQIIMYLAHKHLGLSSTAIGTKLNRKHCTVLHGINAVEDRIPVERGIAEAVEWIEAELKK